MGTNGVFSLNAGTETGVVSQLFLLYCKKEQINIKGKFYVKRLDNYLMKRLKHSSFLLAILV